MKNLKMLEEFSKNLSHLFRLIFLHTIEKQVNKTRKRPYYYRPQTNSLYLEIDTITHARTYAHQFMSIRYVCL